MITITLNDAVKSNWEGITPDMLSLLYYKFDPHPSDYSEFNHYELTPSKWLDYVGWRWEGSRCGWSFVLSSTPLRGEGREHRLSTVKGQVTRLVNRATYEYLPF